MRDYAAHAVFKRYAGVMAYISVEQDGRHSIGSAFHIGEGVFVTARHVTEGKNIKQVAMTDEGYVELTGDEATKTTEFLRGKPVRWIKNGVLEISKGPYYHPDPTVDVAVFQVEGIDPGTPVVQLGGHFDEFLELDDFILEKVIVFGYPPIPFTKSPYLVAVTAEINAQIYRRDVRHIHFILSSMARGGFSGGLALRDHKVLGLVTESLYSNDQPVETGFFTVLSVEPIFDCLLNHNLLSDDQEVRAYLIGY